MEHIFEDETLEDLQIGGLKLIQKKKNFRYGMDAVLLADFANIRSRDAVADFGTGTGIRYNRGTNTEFEFRCF